MAWAVLLAFGRVYLSSSKLYLFLIWNLFLAWVPFYMISFIRAREKYAQRKTLVALAAGAWLLFFPNTLYIITDLFHLRPRSPIPLWYDLVLIFSFLWAGLVLGVKSLWDLEKLLEQWLNKRLVRLLSVCFLFAASYGIYLGRFERWNSWDILTDPLLLLGSVWSHFSNPFENASVWKMTLIFGIMINALFFTFDQIKRNKI